MEVAKNNFLVDSPLIRGEGVRGCPQRKEPFLMFFSILKPLENFIYFVRHIQILIPVYLFIVY